MDKVESPLPEEQDQSPHMLEPLRNPGIRDTWKGEILNIGKDYQPTLCDGLDELSDEFFLS